jgi:DNA-binding NarL/FixJ family response regulator
MRAQTLQLEPLDEQIVDLLLQGCDNPEIARQLNMPERTVKARFNRLFLRFGITSGVKRVKLATVLYRRQLRLQSKTSRHAPPADRRHRIIELVAQGLQNRDVADEIGTTEDVVKNSLRAVYDKLGLWNRVELALWYQARRNEGAEILRSADW